MHKENLKNNLIGIVQNYNQEDNEKVEDMILELNRVTQRSNGKVP